MRLVTNNAARETMLCRHCTIAIATTMILAWGCIETSTPTSADQEPRVADQATVAEEAAPEYKAPLQSEYLHLVATPNKSTPKVSRFSLAPIRRGEHLLALASVGVSGGVDRVEISSCIEAACTRHAVTSFANHLITSSEHPKRILRARACQNHRCSPWQRASVPTMISVDPVLRRFHRKKSATHATLLPTARSFRADLKRLSGNPKVCAEAAEATRRYLDLVTDYNLAAGLGFYAEQPQHREKRGRQVQSGGNWLNENQKLFQRTIVRKQVRVSGDPLPADAGAFEAGLFDLIQPLDFNYADSTVHLSAPIIWAITRLWTEFTTIEAACSWFHHRRQAVVQALLEATDDSRLRLATINQMIIKLEH